jgi:hypothetical protein
MGGTEFFDFSNVRFDRKNPYRSGRSYGINIKIGFSAHGEMIDSEAVEKASMNLS